MFPLLTEALLSVDEFWGRMHFSLRVTTGRSTIFQQSPPPTMNPWAALIGLGGLFVDIRKRGEELGRVGSWGWIWEELGRRVRGD